MIVEELGSKEQLVFINGVEFEVLWFSVAFMSRRRPVFRVLEYLWVVYFEFAVRSFVFVAFVGVDHGCYNVAVAVDEFARALFTIEIGVGHCSSFAEFGGVFVSLSGFESLPEVGACVVVTEL